MIKVYTYKDLAFPVGDNEEVNFTVESVSDGNIGTTSINVPGPEDKVIVDDGTETIGTGADLRPTKTFVVSSIENPVPEEDEIKVNFFINGELIVEHVNPKSESERPMIILIINFPDHE